MTIRPGEPYQTQSARIIPNVSLICTVYNESKTIRDFLESITQLTALPSEIVIVDGGSKDGTVNLMREFLKEATYGDIVQIIVDPSCNLSSSPSPVARGRNVAIRNSTREIIACTDVGCIIEKNWLERIVAPFSESSSIDVVSGWYLADAHTFFQRCLSIVYLIAPENVDSENVLPSSRSIAFKKSAWAKVGGYPERGLWGEDTAFGLQLRKAGCEFVYVPDAIVYWRMEFTLFSFVKSQYEYGFGDGFHSILVFNVFRNMVKIGIACCLIFLGVYLNPWFFILLAMYWWILPLNKRLKDAFRINTIVKFPLLAIIKVFSDLSYIVGYIAGRLTPRQPGSQQEV